MARVKLDEGNQSFEICPSYITKEKMVTISVMQPDGSFEEVPQNIPYDITGYDKSPQSIIDGYVDIDDSLLTLLIGKQAIIQGNTVVDITQTADYLAQVAEANKAKAIETYKEQINALELKRVRALAEGGNYDENTTYLQYYTNQIIDLRAKIQALGGSAS